MNEETPKVQTTSTTSMKKSQMLSQFAGILISVSLYFLLRNPMIAAVAGGTLNGSFVGTILSLSVLVCAYFLLRPESSLSIKSFSSVLLMLFIFQLVNWASYAQNKDMALESRALLRKSSDN